MKRYIVSVRVTQLVRYRVEAESKASAAAAYVAGKAVEYGRTVKREQVEQIREDPLAG